MKPELISFKICPYVQRSVIVLREKAVDFDITFINLMDPPEWLGRLSPLGNVPLLKLGDEVLFESVAIMEYLEEVYTPALHPAEPLAKAKCRAWMEFSTTLLTDLQDLAFAQSEQEWQSARDAIRTKLSRLEEQVQEPFFNGAGFQLVDAAYAPFFMRLDLLEQWSPGVGLSDTPMVARWAAQLLQHSSVSGSVVDEFPELYSNKVAGSGGYGAKRYKA